MKNPNVAVGSLTMAGDLTAGTYTKSLEYLHALTKLQKFIQDYTGTTPEKLTGGLRKKELVTARRLFYALSYYVLKPTFPETFTYDSVSRQLNQDHSTLMHALKQHNILTQENELYSDKEYIKIYLKAYKEFQVIINPTTINGILSTREVIVEKIAELTNKQNQIDAFLLFNGYHFDEQNNPVKDEQKSNNTSPQGPQATQEIQHGAGNAG